MFNSYSKAHQKISTISQNIAWFFIISVADVCAPYLKALRKCGTKIGPINHKQVGFDVALITVTLSSH